MRGPKRYNKYNSIYSNFLCYESLPDGRHSNLSSKHQRNYSKDKLLQRNKSTDFRTASTFKMKIENDEFEFTHTIPALDDIQEQNVIAWSTILLNLSQKCNWSN